MSVTFSSNPIAEIIRREWFKKTKPRLLVTERFRREDEVFNHLELIVVQKEVIRPPDREKKLSPLPFFECISEVLPSDHFGSRPPLSPSKFVSQSEFSNLLPNNANG